MEARLATSRKTQMRAMRSWLMAAAAFGLLAAATPALAACDLAASDAAHAGDHQGGEHQAPHGLDGEGGEHDMAARVAVDDMAGRQRQAGERQELHQADEAEIEGAAGEIIDLPADRHRADLAGKSREASRQQEEEK